MSQPVMQLYVTCARESEREREIYDRPLCPKPEWKPLNRVEELKTNTRIGLIEAIQDLNEAGYRFVEVVDFQAEEGSSRVAIGERVKDCCAKQ